MRRDVVVVDAVRTPVGRRGGALSGVHPAELSAVVLRALAERTGVSPGLVDDVVWGCVTQVGEQSINIGRTAVLSAGWPVSVPATTVDRQCGSSQQALHFAAAGILAGQYEVAVAGGVESMSRVPMGSSFAGGSPFGSSYAERFGEALPNQGLAAEEIARRFSLDRTALDSFALESHARAAEAVDAGAFSGQVAAVTLDDGAVVDADEGVRRGGTLDALAALKPAFREDGLLHAGNSSQISDGAAALLLMTSARARELQVEPIARVHTAVVAGDDPGIMLTAPIPATRKVLARSGLSLGEIGAFEVNEAFASIPLAWRSQFEVPEERLNPVGGAIAIGHPMGGSGARIATTLVHHMRDRQIRYGLQTMCEGGGLANATVFELVA